jgi:outer membrane protein
MAAALLVAGLGLEDAAQAQESGPALTLEDAITLALLDNPSVENAELDVEKAGLSIDSASSNFFPVMTAKLTAGHNLVDKVYSFDTGAFGTFAATGPIPATTTEIQTEEDWQATVSFTVVQSISGIFKVELEVEKLTLEERTSAESLRATLQDTVKDVKQQYYQILATQADLENAEASIALYEELEREVANKVEQRTAFEYDLLDVQAELAQSRQQAEADRHDIETQKEQLNLLMGRDPGEPFQTVGDLQAYPLVIDSAVASEVALAQRPEMQEALLREEIARIGVDLAEFEYIPDVGALLEYSNSNSSFRPDYELFVGMQLSWEIYDWGGRAANVSSEKLSVVQAQNNVRSVRDQIVADVNATLRELEDAVATVEVVRLSQKAAEEKLRVTNNRYRQDTALLSDLLDAESDLSSANDDYVKAVLSVLEVQAELARAMGEE